MSLSVVKKLAGPRARARKVYPTDNSPAEISHVGNSDLSCCLYLLCLSKLLPFIGNSSGGVSIHIYQEVGDQWISIPQLFLLKANGSIYRFHGKVDLFDCTFIGEGDEMNRLTFQVTKQGLVYVRGKGKVNLKDGSEKKFGY